MITEDLKLELFEANKYKVTKYFFKQKNNKEQFDLLLKEIIEECESLEDDDCEHNGNFAHGHCDGCASDEIHRQFKRLKNIGIDSITIDELCEDFQYERLENIDEILERKTFKTEFDEYEYNLVRDQLKYISLGQLYNIIEK